MRTSIVIAVLFVGLFTGLAAAGDPPPEPAPMPAPEPAAVVIRPWGRVSRYAVWQDYAVDQQGHFRPRVLYTPDGAFYYYNGQPYPWLSAHPKSFMPYAGD
jgi:hypothetical protein